MEKFIKIKYDPSKTENNVPNKIGETILINPLNAPSYRAEIVWKTKQYIVLKRLDTIGF